MAKTITKRMQFVVIRAVRQELMALQTAVRAEDRETADRLARQISTSILGLTTESLNQKLAEQE